MYLLVGGEVDPERESFAADGALVRLLTRMQLAVKPGMEHMFEQRVDCLVSFAVKGTFPHSHDDQEANSSFDKD